MVKERASIFDNESDELDLSAFSPKLLDDGGPPRDQVKLVSEAASFRSREPSIDRPPASGFRKREPRRHRTGRNQQFNVKATVQTIEAFYAISDHEGWVLGETLENALAALQRELQSGAR